MDNYTDYTAQNGTPYTVNNIPVTDYPQPANTDSPADTGKNKATASMVLGIFSIVLSIVAIFAGPVAVVSLACGIIAIILSKRSKQAAFLARLPRRAEEKAGLITGIIGTISSGIIVAVKLLITGAIMLIVGLVTQYIQGLGY